MNDVRKIETVTSPVQSTYKTDSFRKVRDKETGKVEVKRWVEDRQVTPSVQLDREAGAVFFRGARIA